MTTGGAVMRKAGVLLNDADHVRWTLPELCDYINAAVRQIVLGKPSASPRSFPFALQRGTWQQVPDTGNPKPVALLDVTRNLQTTDPGTRIGLRSVRAVPKAQLDAQEPDWHNERTVRFAKLVRHFYFDENNPRDFFVYPGNDGTGIVELVMSVLPAPLDATGDVDLEASYDTEIGLSDLYEDPVLEFVLFKAESKDDLAANGGRAMSHFQLFASAIGLKTQVEAATSPNARRGSK